MAAKNKKSGYDPNIPLYLFHEGTNAKAYEFLGAHLCENGAVFRVWAPNAAKVYVTGSFNGWQANGNPMQKSATVCGNAVLTVFNATIHTDL